MSEFKAGDLAMTIRDCCGIYLGIPVRVGSIERVSLPQWITCTTCKHGYSNIEYAVVDQPGRLWRAPLHWLKKIDPPAETESEGETKKEDLREPA